MLFMLVYHKDRNRTRQPSFFMSDLQFDSLFFFQFQNQFNQTATNSCYISMIHQMNGHLTCTYQYRVKSGLSFNYGLASKLQSDTPSLAHTHAHTHTTFPLPLVCTKVYTIHVLKRTMPSLNNDIKTSCLIMYASNWERKKVSSPNVLLFELQWLRNHMPFYFCTSFLFASKSKKYYLRSKIAH